MISVEDFYKVMCAMVPLYFAMLVAYTVKWWKIFKAEQCAGINRFVAVFAVPILSFHFISQNNPFKMDTKFILADTFSKLLVFLLLSLWAVFFSGDRRGRGLDWFITLFSLATLPNTLVMGIPLLSAMYGDFTQPLMVQLLVLQCIIWYTVLLFLFEYKAATLLIQNQFPGSTAAAITKFEVDADVVSLDGQGKFITESEIDAQGQIGVRIRRSTSSAPDSGLSSIGITPRPSNLSNVEIFSVNTPTQLHGEHQSTDMSFDLGSGYGSSDAYSLQPTPRASNFNEMDTMMGNNRTPTWGRSPVGGRMLRQGSPAVRRLWEFPENGGEGQGEYKAVLAEQEISFRDNSITIGKEEVEAKRTQKMPNTFVMIKLILTLLIRKLSRNPNTYSTVLALLWSLLSFKWKVEMPSLVKESIKIISDAGLGMAMFSLGLFMGMQQRMIACGGKRGLLGILGIRFVFGPIAMSAASLAVGLRGLHLRTAILQAALPQGIVPFVFAREYGLHPDVLSTGVIFGILISLPINLIYYILLGL